MGLNMIQAYTFISNYYQAKYEKIIRTLRLNKNVKQATDKKAKSTSIHGDVYRFQSEVCDLSVPTNNVTVTN